MRVKILLEKENMTKNLEVPKGRTIESVLKSLKINPQTVIVSKNGEVVPEQDALQDKDILKIIRVK